MYQLQQNLSKLIICPWHDINKNILSLTLINLHFLSPYIFELHRLLELWSLAYLCDISSKRVWSEVGEFLNMLRQNIRTGCNRSGRWPQHQWAVHWGHFFHWHLKNVYLEASILVIAAQIPFITMILQHLTFKLMLSIWCLLLNVTFLNGCLKAFSLHAEDLSSIIWINSAQANTRQKPTSVFVYTLAPILSTLS